MGSLNTDRDIQMDIEGFFTQRERDIHMDKGVFFEHR